VVKDFIKRLLCLSPVDRLKFEEVMDHPFIYNFNIAKELEVSFAVTHPSKNFIKNYNKEIRNKKIEANIQAVVLATPQKSAAKTLPK
jgi:serine/threonine protein kinase